MAARGERGLHTAAVHSVGGGKWGLPTATTSGVSGEQGLPADTATCIGGEGEQVQAATAHRTWRRSI